MSTDLDGDLVAKCRDQLSFFKIRELRLVLSQLGVAKQGRKQDLVDRVLTLLSSDRGPMPGRINTLGKDGVAKIVDNTFRKTQGLAARDPASESHAGSGFNEEIPEGKPFGSSQLEMIVRCPCGNSFASDQMIQCEDPRCGLWQHMGCVINLEKPLDGVLELSSKFYCEICRIYRADPFWVTIRQPLFPVRLTSSNSEQTLERTFNLSRADRDLVQNDEYDIQVWCLLLNDKVPFRMQWPQYAKLQINGIALGVVARPETQLLGINGRDDGPIITAYCREGLNTISLTRCDSRPFCFGVRLTNRQTLQQVFDMIPKEGEGELFTDALARVRRCVGGGAATENADSDSDIEVVADFVTVNLCCPMSGSLITIAGRFKACVHMGCFDLETFLELNQRSRKWQCPICMKNYSLENVIIDPYFNRITSMLQSCGEDVKEIDVKPDGAWRAKIENGSKDVASWHSPDGALFGTTDVEGKSDLEKASHVMELASEGRLGLRIGIKRNRNGTCEVSKPDNIRLYSPGSSAICKYENDSPVASMGRSAAGSYIDKKDINVNQGGKRFDLSLCNGGDSFFSQNKEPRHIVNDRHPTAPSNVPDVIVLSDSDDDNVAMFLPVTGYGNSCQAGVSSFQSCNQIGFTGKSAEDPVMGTDASFSFGLFNDSDDIGIPFWAMETQSDPGFQLFGNEEVLDGFNLVGNDVANTANAGDLSSFQLNTKMNETLVDNPLAFNTNDPSLQLFLPMSPTEVSLDADVNGRCEAPTMLSSDDWTSLSLAAGGGQVEAASHTGEQGVNHFIGQENGIEHFDEAAIHFSTKGAKRNGENSINQRSSSMVSGSCEQNSIKPVFLSVDIDSD